MPSESECGEYDIVSKEWLLGKLRSDDSSFMLIDCRSSNDYGVSHIRSAVNFSIPSIMLRRLAAGKIDLISTVQCKDMKNKISACRARGMFILYGDTPPGKDTEGVYGVLLRRLKMDAVQVACLEGVYDDFRSTYPEWCIEAGTQQTLPQLPLIGLSSLRISSGGYIDDRSMSSGSSSDCEESSHHHRDFPVEIVPYLFLGNSTNSEDCEGLARRNIKYILNVTPDLPNTFERAGGEINYLKIPITDHWSQSLTEHFPDAFRFIEEGVSGGRGVLVHCVAGVSRSVSLTVAYLMQRHRLRLNDAFSLVRARHPDAAPNFHFLRQLHTFERDLGLHREANSLSKVLEEIGAACIGASPDSGIEFDRWSSTHPTPTTNPTPAHAAATPNK